MVERHSWAVQQVAGVGVQTVEDARHSMGALWYPAGAITSRSGMVPSGSAAVPGNVLATGTPDGFVHVNPFRFVMQSVRGGGTYVLVLDAIKDLNILGTQAADPTNARIDLIIAQQNDAYFADANSDMVVKQVVGTPSGSPVDPTVTGSTDYVLLARVTVPANATTIQTANIANVAIVTAVATGGVMPIGGQTERDALANPFAGMSVYRRDTNWVETRSATAWRVPDFVKTSALANITSPLTGQLALLTTDNVIYRWNGSAWVGVVNAGGGESWGTMGVHRPTANVTGSGITEKVGCFVTFNAILGRRYKATYTADFASSNANASNLTNVNPALLRMRVKAGSDGTAIDGTVFDARDFSGLSNGYNVPQNMIADWVATSTAQFTIVACFAATSGAAGNVTQSYSVTNHMPKLIVEDIGL